MLLERAEVLKFGGTSVGGFETFQQSCNVVEQHKRDGEGKGLVVVVSAMAGVTNSLIKAYKAALNHDLDASFGLIDRIEEQHKSVIMQLGESAKAREAKVKVDEITIGVKKILNAISLLGEDRPRIKDLVLSAGERMSPHLFAAFLQNRNVPVTVFDADQVVKTDNSFGDAFPDFESSGAKVKELVFPQLEAGKVVVIGGFYGTNTSGDITTMGRGGSDLSATTMGRVLNDSGCEVLGVYLYKADVAGVMTADPRIVPSAIIVPHLSRDEAAAATMLGTSVIHPRAIHALPKKIPIFVRSTLQEKKLTFTIPPREPETRIDGDSYDYGLPVKIITTLPKLGLLTLSGPGMDRPGIAELVFGELSRSGINVRAITQPPTEGVMMIVIPPDAQIDPVIGRLNQSFAISMKAGDIADIKTEEVSAIGLVGDGVGKPEVLEKVFGVLKQEPNITNGNGSSNSGTIFIGPSDRQYTLFLRADRDGERAKLLVRRFHKMLVEDRDKS